MSFGARHLSSKLSSSCRWAIQSSTTLKVRHFIIYATMIKLIMILESVDPFYDTPVKCFANHLMQNGKAVDRPVVQNPALSTIFSKQVMGHSDLLSSEKFDATHRPEASWQRMLVSQPPIISIELTLLQHGYKGRFVGGVIYSMPGHHHAGHMVTMCRPMTFQWGIRMANLMQGSTMMFGQNRFVPSSVTLAVDQTEKWVVAECDLMTAVSLQGSLQGCKKDEPEREQADGDFRPTYNNMKRNAEEAFKGVKPFKRECKIIELQG